MLLFVSSVDCLVILVAGNWALLQVEKWQSYYRVLDLFCLDNIFAKPRTKMTTVLRSPRQNDVGLQVLKVVLWENLVLVVVLVLESKALYWSLSYCDIHIQDSAWSLTWNRTSTLVQWHLKLESEWISLRNEKCLFQWRKASVFRLDMPLWSD